MFDLNISFIDNNTALSDHMSEIGNLKYFGLDIETTGLDPFSSKLLLLQLGTEHKQFVIDARKCNIKPLKPILEDESIKKYTAFGAFEYKWLKRSGIETEHLIDVLTAERLLNVGRIALLRVSLESVALKYLNLKLNKDVRDSFPIHRGPFSREQIEYGAGDIIAPLQIFRNHQQKLLLDEGLMPTFNLETECVPVFGDLEYNGIYLDRKMWLNLYESNLKKEEELKEKSKKGFKKVCDTNLFGDIDINISSEEQVLAAYRLLGYPINSVGEEILRTDIDPDDCKDILEYRGVSKLITTYGKKYTDAINPVTKRLHSGFFMVGTSTGRPASKSPNMLNIPRDKRYRSCFRAQNGGKILTNDFAGQELRITAEFTKDPGWVAAFMEDENIHKKVGSQLFSLILKREVSIDKSDTEIDLGGGIKAKSVELYDITKNINFGSLYGAGPAKIMQLFKSLGMDFTMDQSKIVSNAHRRSCEVVYQALDEARDFALHNEVSISLGGRKRYFPHPVINDMPGKTENEKYKKYKAKCHAIRREGGNMVIQGTAADVFKRSMVLLRKKIKKRNKSNELKLLLPIYDEIVCESEKNHEENNELVQKCMLLGQEHYQFTVPAAVEGTIADCWQK